MRRSHAGEPLGFVFDHRAEVVAAKRGQVHLSQAVEPLGRSMRRPHASKPLGLGFDHGADNGVRFTYRDSFRSGKNGVRLENGVRFTYPAWLNPLWVDAPPARQRTATSWLRPWRESRAVRKRAAAAGTGGWVIPPPVS